ncbi:hypothetical protein EJ04DRAFT_484181 [Polyplosphaeria fusca]|uniref:COP9 signalosome complex subunit 3 N-terminal helical repeats domain-containing protein n=1 Tax=Polyplosphaeria fusca TaxID=682080 RepID=A0A9P4R5A5_9PLEO|nr:hypothetical protein EJ04DRAFT_484181 [Polyplosphaeria fusca]
MSSELLQALWSFQPDSPEVQQKREYDHQARQFRHQVSNISTSHFLKGAETPQDVLEALNPSVNSIAYIFALHARISAAIDNKFNKSLPESVRPGGYLWNKVDNFMNTFDPVQIRYVGTEWRKLMEYLERVARITGSPGVAISPIRSGLLQLDPLSGTLTHTHLYLLRLCVECRSYEAALPILDNYIHSIPGAIPSVILEGQEYSVPAASNTNSGEYIHVRSGHTDKLHIADVQEYYVLGAMAYIGVHQFKKAKQFLEHVLIVPAHSVANGLMLEAYKKWVLLSCLADGSVKSPPRTANGPAMKLIKTASKAYDAVADAFQQLGNFAKLKSQVLAGKDIWAEDGNTGLVNELIEQQERFYISRLSRTYSAIPVSNIASNLEQALDEVTVKLEKLISDGHLNACIERTDKASEVVILRFFLDPTQGPLAKTEVEQQQALMQQTQRTNALAEQVKSADYRLSLSKEFVDHVKRQNKKMAVSGAGDAMDTTWDDGMDVEEDIMADMH